MSNFKLNSLKSRATVQSCPDINIFDDQGGQFCKGCQFSWCLIHASGWDAVFCVKDLTVLVGEGFIDWKKSGQFGETLSSCCVKVCQIPLIIIMVTIAIVNN